MIEGLIAFYVVVSVWAMYFMYMKLLDIRLSQHQAQIETSKVIERGLYIHAELLEQSKRLTKLNWELRTPPILKDSVLPPREENLFLN